ncbi:HNH endonuclease [Streptomyces sp. MBT49]|uniref:HNH endonuclease family protein n=1 Tax=Streptomyces sp. MBT49 TaxID=1488380 RepID=UPI00190D5C80|nr:HNH endonuclease family protein [Streptomyces sp. MBT49]MBK3629690.1 HNH endonuclease [Streptomyces sp. MBT49]
MIKKLHRLAAVLALSLLPVAAPATAATAARPSPTAAGPAAETAAPAAAQDVPLFQALEWVGEAPESRDGYSREKFKHWNRGLNPTDGCDTRREVILAEAKLAPEVGAACALTGGRWFSEYDQVWVTAASSLDVDHMVPLAEAWDSGASAWTAARREAYANDQGAAASLIAVSGSSNRSKSDKDPADWLPAEGFRCEYAGAWVATKLRWRLPADPAERDALTRLAEACPDTLVSYEQVPQ